MKQPRLWNRQLQGVFTEGLAEDLKQEPEMPRVGSRTLQAVDQHVRRLQGTKGRTWQVQGQTSDWGRVAQMRLKSSQGLDPLTQPGSHLSVHSELWSHLKVLNSEAHDSNSTEDHPDCWRDKEADEMRAQTEPQRKLTLPKQITESWQKKLRGGSWGDNTKKQYMWGPRNQEKKVCEGRPDALCWEAKYCEDRKAFPGFIS